MEFEPDFEDSQALFAELHVEYAGKVSLDLGAGGLSRLVLTLTRRARQFKQYSDSPAVAQAC